MCVLCVLGGRGLLSWWGPQRPVLSRLTCLGASWEPQPWLLDLPWRDCASGQMPPTPTPCRTCEGAEQSPHARWSGCQVPTWALKPCLHVVLHPGGRMAGSTADTLQAGGGASPVELAGPHRVTQAARCYGGRHTCMETSRVRNQGPPSPEKQLPEASAGNSGAVSSSPSGASWVRIGAARKPPRASGVATWPGGS